LADGLQCIATAIDDAMTQ